MADRMTRGREALQAGQGEMASPIPPANLPGLPLHIPLRGPSMTPTLRPLDLLEVEPYGERAVRAGDVVAFLPAGEKAHVVHRVVRVGPEGIRTLGDNNRYEDGLDLGADDLAGRVIAAWRGQKRREVYGGLAGRLLVRSARITQRLDRGLSYLLRPAYHALARGGILRAVLPRALRPRLVRFGTAAPSSRMLLWFGLVIGRYDANLGRWVIRRPFKLFVDENALPSSGVR